MSAVVIRDLVKRYKQTTAVAGISLDVAEGEIFGLLGPNGAGKTTTISALCTLVRPTSGSLTVAGHDVASAPAAVRRAIGLVFQETTLDVDLTAQENLDFHARLYKLQDRQQRVRAGLEMVDLYDRRNHLVKTFSGGMKRRLEIARSLLHEPSVLFLDEPTLGLDPDARRMVWQHLRQVKARGNTTIILTTHYMEEADTLCDRLAIIHAGEVVASGVPRELKAALGGDIVEVQLADGYVDRFEPATLAAAGFADVERPGPGQLRLAVQRSEQQLVDIVTAFPREALESIAIKRPTLEDVFLHHTGSALTNEVGSTAGREGDGAGVGAGVGVGTGVGTDKDERFA